MVCQNKNVFFFMIISSISMVSRVTGCSEPKRTEIIEVTKEQAALFLKELIWVAGDPSIPSSREHMEIRDSILEVLVMAQQLIKPDDIHIRAVQALKDFKKSSDDRVSLGSKSAQGHFYESLKHSKSAELEFDDQFIRLETERLMDYLVLRFEYSQLVFSVVCIKQKIDDQAVAARRP